MTKFMDIQVETFTMEKDFDTALGTWRSFVERNDVTCGFHCDPLVVSKGVRFSHEQGLVLVTVFGESNEIIAILPFLRLRVPLPMQLGLWRLATITARQVFLSDYEFAVDNKITRSSILPSVLSALVEKQLGDIIVSPNCAVDEEEEFRERLRKHIPKLRIEKEQKTYLLDLPETFDEYLAGLRSKTRKNLRYQVRSFGRKTGREIFVRRYDKESQIGEFCEHIRSVWQKSWQGKLGMSPPPEVSSITGIAARGWLRGYVLFADSAPVAYVAGYQYCRCYYYESIAYDPTWRDHSPGSVLNYLLLEDLFTTRRPDILDFGCGYNQYKEALGSRTENRAQLVMPIAPKTRLALLIQRGLNRIHKMLKPLLLKAGIFKQLKRLAQSRNKQK